MSRRMWCLSLVALLFLPIIGAADQPLHIESPADGAVSHRDHLAVIAAGQPGGWIELQHNGETLRRQLVRTDGRADFLNIDLPAGPSQLSVHQKISGGTTLVDSVRIHVVGPPAAIQIQAQPSTLSADSLSFSQVEVRVRDAWGLPQADGLLITLQLSAGELVADDLYPDQPGVQLQLRDGMARLLVRSPGRVGTGRLRASAGGVSAEQLFNYTTPTVEWLLVGQAQGQIGWNQDRQSGRIPGRRDEGGSYHSKRLSFYTRGTVGDGWLLTSACDSDRHYDDQVFRFLRPEQVYPVYGDASSIFYEAPSTGRFFARVEKDSSFAQAGDFTTRLSDGELTAYNRSFSGGVTQMAKNRLRVRGFATRTEQAIQVDEIPGEGISGQYYLSAAQRGLALVEGSERVAIQTRHRLHPEQIVRTVRQYRYSDYEIDYEAGTLLFKRPVPARSPEEHPIIIVVTYETVGATDHRWIGGGNVHLRATESLEVGATAVRENRLGADYYLTGVEGRWSPDERLSLHSEAARSSGATADWAWKLEGRGKVNSQVGYELYYRDAGRDFDNPNSPSARPGTRKLRGRLRWSPLQGAQITGEAYHSDDSINDEERLSGTLGSRLRRGQWTQALSLTGTRRRGRGPTVRSATLNAGLEWEASRRLSLGVERDQTFGDEELDYRPTLNRLTGRWLLKEGITAIVEHSFRDDSFHKASYTRWGLESELSDDLEAYARYELDSGLRREQNQAIVGLRHRYRPRTDLTLHTTFERMRTLRGDRRGDFHSYSLAAEYLPARPFKGSGRFERREGVTLDKTVASAAVDFSLARSLALLGKHTFTDESRPLDGGDRGLSQHHLIAGMAYRGYTHDWLNALGKYELKIEDNGLVRPALKKTTHIGSFEAIVEPFPRLEWYGRYAFKRVELKADAKATALTDLWITHLRWGWSDVWDVMGEYRLLTQHSADDYHHGAAAETGFKLVENARLGIGYNFAGYDDRDLAGAEYWARGPYMKVQLKFGEAGVGAVLNGLRSGLR